jgi:type I restriction enzyme S subunit
MALRVRGIGSLEQGNVRTPRINPEDLGLIPVSLPTSKEQTAIADLLDAETARIDALLAKKQRMIELLVERRRVFVSKAMTTGLDNQAPLVPTESEFAPELPRDWDLQRLRNVVIRIIDTAHKTAPVVDGGPYLVVRTSNVKQGRLVLNEARYTDAETWQEWTLRGVPQPGDVMFTREAPAGEACVVPEGAPLCIGQRMVLLQVDRTKIYGEWLMHSIYSGPAQRFIELLSNATTVAHLNMSDIPDIPLTVPPLGEQHRILEQVRHHVERADLLVSRLDAQLSLLQERRQALITAAVTGQIDIPEVAA